MPKLQYDDIYKKITMLNATRSKSEHLTQARAKQLSNLIFRYVSVQEFNLITQDLNREMTNQELAKLIVASANGNDISEVAPVSPDLNIALKFRYVRRQKGFSQKQVADTVGIMTEHQIEEAESKQIVPTFGEWSQLFRAIGRSIHFKFV